MNLDKLQFAPTMPIKCVLSLIKFKLSWHDIKWAFDHGIYGRKAIIEFAKNIEKKMKLKMNYLI